MDWWLVLKILQWTVAFGALTFMIVSLIIAAKLRGVLHWKRSLDQEIKLLEIESGKADPRRKQALEIVIGRCRATWSGSSQNFGDLASIPDYVKSIAACYAPGEENPEMLITVGRLLATIQESLERVDLILQRPGFQKLRRVRIRHIQDSYHWYRRLSENKFLQWLERYQKIIRKVFFLRLLVLPDPISWLAYLSNQMTLLTLTRYLMADIYLFVGKTAIQAYDEEQDDFSPELEALEGTLYDLDSLEQEEMEINNAKVREIRARLVDVSGMIFSEPTIKDWKNAVVEAAHATAEGYFPDAKKPLEEAAIGPIIEQCRSWGNSICETEKKPVIRRLHRVRLETLYNIKSLTDTLLPKPVRAFMKKNWETYKWMKWPLKVYRWVKKASPVGIAMDVGWIVARKSCVNLLYRQTFDMAYKELDTVYKQSRDWKDNL